ncbi:MAG: SIMPL domain-containing protein [Candidatus Paceibacterota bacterium]
MEQNTTQSDSMLKEKTKLFKIGSVVLLVLAFFIAIQAVNSIREFWHIGSEIEPQATISVSGEGEVFAVPDTARVSFSVIETAETTEGAQSAASERISEVLAALADLDIDENDIKTQNYTLNPRYEYSRTACEAGQLCPPEGRQILVGYELRQTIEVKVEDRERASDVVQILGDTGVQQISNVQLTIDDEDAVNAEARAEAIADAKAKAQELASDLGVRLVRVIRFEESGQPYPYARMESVQMAFNGDDAVASPQLPAGENRIVSNVNITYEIR